jgi:translation initiation factor IF-1
MPVTINVNRLSLVHQGSDGTAVASVPDVCLTSTPNGPVPMPYPNIAMSRDLSGGSTTVHADGYSAAIKGCTFATSSGDEPGSVGGVTSGVNKGPAEFTLYSFDVKIDGANACRLTDPMTMNRRNTVCQAELQGPVVIPPGPTDWVEIRLTTPNGEPVPGARFELTLPDGDTRRGRLDFRGRKKVTGILPGSAIVRFPELEDQTWTKS